MNSQHLLWNGIDGVSGGFVRPFLTIRDLARAALRQAQDPRSCRWMRLHLDLLSRGRLGPMESVDPLSLAQAGWAVVFARDTANEVIEALQPLLRMRRDQASQLDANRYRELSGGDGFALDEHWLDFLARWGVGPGPVNPNRLPYYLLLVGSPAQIPFQVQSLLDVQFAVGRIFFETVEDYARYARSVVAAERGQIERSRSFALLATRHHDDEETRLSCKGLAGSICRMLRRHPEWSVERMLGNRATKSRLVDTLSRDRGPALAFTATHGLDLPEDHPLLLSHQGALVCQDWTGPLEAMGLPTGTGYLCGEDFAHTSSTGLGGLIGFHFACFAAGTSGVKSLLKTEEKEPSQVRASRPFLSRLPQRMLSHPAGGALAIIGNVDRALQNSFCWPKEDPRNSFICAEVFTSVLERLMDGSTVGWAMEFLNKRHAELATYLSDELVEVRMGKKSEDQKSARLWNSYVDARNYVVIGDPAVRLALSTKWHSGARKGQII